MTTLTENQNGTTDRVEIEIIDGIEYKLFHNQYGPAMRVLDIASDEVVGLTNFKSESQAGSTFDAAVAYARRVD
jgi:hypothetical protein